MEKAGASDQAGSDIAVQLSVESVSKKFCRNLRRSLMYGLSDIRAELTDRSRQSETLRAGEFWALDDVSFQLRRGEALGLVGPNGAGKSTLLRIISGLIKLDAGRVRVKGRVAPLIALGAAFNPILTGRENIYINMSILGLSRKEIDAKFDEVVAFTELGDAMEAPIQTYSSGMAARLGFACAVHTDPDILLIDEVLAVGDIKFRMKCYRHLARLRERGTSFILVSHNQHTVLRMCQKAIYLSRGRVSAAGDAASVLNQYEKALFSISHEDMNEPLRLPPKPAGESSGLDITSVCFKDEFGTVLETPVSGQPVSLCLGCHAHREISDIQVIVAVSSESAENERVLYLSNQYDNQPMSVKPGEAQLELQLPYCGLSRGLYSAKIIVNEKIVNTLDAVESFRFLVNSNGITRHNLFYQPRNWKASNK